MKRRSRERFQEIVRVFASYGFGYLIDSTKNNKKSPENLRKAIEELGPTFIKIGQILSTRSDILPQEYVKELVKLQDSVPKEKSEILEEVFEGSIHKRIDECFIYYNKEPLASASVAEVHEAKLLDGRNVVVKIQRPNIYEMMKMDLSILRRIIKFAGSKVKFDIKVVDPLEVLDEIEQTTEEELSFINEGKNIIRFKEENKDIAPVYVPELINYIWSEKVLVLERIEGFKINDIDAIKKFGYDNKDIAKKLSVSYCNQIFEKGFFHADPHPGNLLISDGKICFIDFGIMGTIDENLREWLNLTIIAIVTKDKNKVVDCILAIGIKEARISRGDLYDDVSYLVDTYLATSLKNIKIRVLIEEVFNITKKNNIQMPRELVTLVRGLVILEGVVAEVDPQIEIISIVSSYMKSRNKMFLFSELRKEDIIISAYDLVRDLSRLPSRAIELLDKTSNGKTDIKLSITNLDKIFSEINVVVNRLTGGLIVSSLLIASSLIIASKVKPCYKGISIIGIIGYGLSTIFAMIILRDMRKTKNNKLKGNKNRKN